MNILKEDGLHFDIYFIREGPTSTHKELYKQKSVGLHVDMIRKYPRIMRTEISYMQAHYREIDYQQAVLKPIFNW